ncbi:hypothetical protein [Streptosporangium pseudovulgare]|uniref:Uncharacterized protein n=1 Tax=Streptosporangium pseudovulgare TaxID=35765 RepID=A0ABQ2QLM6_9ACTN|nr:hypothetical protein [Streptosporangium pseudovulgare]GGP87435.1 hypothetical protein GCM10010140_15970 [Streptosporangium pseudovulgare]
MTVYTLSIIEGEAGRDAVGTELFSPGCPVHFSQLDPFTLTWLSENGYEEPNRHVLVTPAGREPAALNVVASREVDL